LALNSLDGEPWAWQLSGVKRTQSPALVAAANDP
jgi:hypothetical protein